MYKNHRRQVMSLGAALAVAAALTACTSAAPSHGELADNQKILASCDQSAPPASDVQIDGTGSSASERITAERMVAIESIVRRTAICSGRLRVSVFSSSSAAAVTLFDGTLPQHGATDNARLKRVPRVVEDAMSEIRGKYQAAAATLPGGGSDITSQYRLAAEWIGQLDDTFKLHLYLLTDGFQTVDIKVGGRALSKREATKLADKTAMPKLPGAVVTVAGLGRVAGKPPRSRVVAGLVAYYDTLCRKSGATKCVSVTDYTAAGGR